MRIWPGISWREIDTEWTGEQFNLMLIKFMEQQERNRIDAAREQAKASGNVMITDDEIAGRM